MKGHPSELFFKYMQLIAIDRRDQDAEIEFAEQMIYAINNVGPTIEVIMKYAKLECHRTKNEKEKMKTDAMNLCNYLKESYVAFNKKKIPENVDESIVWLDSVVTFMYK